MKKRIVLTTYSKRNTSRRYNDTINFSVPYEWLENFLLGNKWGTLHEYLDTYTWDDSEVVRSVAEDDKVFKYSYEGATAV